MFSYRTYADARLLALLKDGDEKSFTEIYERHWETLFAISYHYSGDKTAAEEIVQEVFMRLWDKREIIEIGQLGAYLATACKFSVFKQKAKEKRRKQLLKEHTQTNEWTIDEEAAITARFLDEFIHGIVEQLPPQCKIVYKLKQDQGFSIEDIARELTISPNTARNHLTKARSLILRVLKEANGWMFFLF